jgi:hypothetical protein
MMKNNNEENFEVEDYEDYYEENFRRRGGGYEGREKRLYNGAFAMIIIGTIVLGTGHLMMIVNLDFRTSRHYVLGNKRFIKRRIERYKRHKKIVRSDNYMIVMIILYVVGLILLIAGFLILKKIKK